jgi:hypothetical protein
VRRATNGGRQTAGDEGRATKGGRQTAGDKRRATKGGRRRWIACTRIRQEWEHGRLIEAIRRVNVAEGAGHYSPGRTIYHHQLARGSAGERIAALT